MSKIFLISIIIIVSVILVSINEGKNYIEEKENNNIINSEIKEKIKLQNIEDKKYIKEFTNTEDNKNIEQVTDKSDVVSITEKKIQKIINLPDDNLIYSNKENKIDKNGFQIDKNNYFLNKDNLIDVKGKNIENIKEIKIGDNIFIPQIKNNKCYILIEKNIIKEGVYEINIILKNGKNIILKNNYNFSKNITPLYIDYITPEKIKNDIARNIILQGKGFTKTISIQLSNNIVLTETSFNIINDNVLAIIIPSKLKEGYYTLNIMSTTGIYKSDINIEITK